MWIITEIILSYLLNVLLRENLIQKIEEFLLLLLFNIYCKIRMKTIKIKLLHYEYKS